MAGLIVEIVYIFALVYVLHGLGSVRKGGVGGKEGEIWSLAMAWEVQWIRLMDDPDGFSHGGVSERVFLDPDDVAVLAPVVERTADILDTSQGKVLVSTNHMRGG